jgi:hypothetical protein
VSVTYHERVLPLHLNFISRSRVTSLRLLRVLRFGRISTSLKSSFTSSSIRGIVWCRAENFVTILPISAYSCKSRRTGRDLFKGEKMARNKTATTSWNNIIVMVEISLMCILSIAVSSDGFRLPSIPKKRFEVKRRMMLGTQTQQVCNWYMKSLVCAPIITKGITTGVIEVLGDGIAQGVEMERERIESKAVKWDYRRSLGCLCDGIFVTGPLLHFTYNFLERIIPSHGAGGSAWATLAQVLIDEFVCDPIDVGLYLIATSIIEGKNVKQRLREKYWVTLLEGMAVSLALCPIQFISFRYLPVETRVLVVNICDLIWMSIVSYVAHSKITTQAQSKAIN